MSYWEFSTLKKQLTQEERSVGAKISMKGGINLDISMQSDFNHTVYLLLTVGGEGSGMWLHNGEI